MAQHFDSVEELMATSNGGGVDKSGLTLDDLATANFRGTFGKGSTCLYPQLEDCYYSSKFLQLARDYWDAQYSRPTLMLFNLCGPHHSSLNAHLDAVTFRGIRIENAPVWLQNVMGRSGLFTEYMVKMAQVEHPLWNKGVVVQNEMMFHRGDPAGRPDERDITGLKNRSLLQYDAGAGDWIITTDGEVIRRYQPQQMRLLVHWSAEVYSDAEELEMNLDRSRDLTFDVVFERLLADLKARGVHVTEPSDPLHDRDFIRALTANYSIVPTKDWAKEAA
jgi:hypothetical protein